MNYGPCCARAQTGTHDGRWARATTEASLAILTSAREGRDIDLQWQVPWR